MRRGPGWSVAVAATLAMSVSYVDRQVLAALADSVKRDLGISHQAYGWLQSAFSMAYLVAAPVAGALVDRVGARRGLLIAVLVWSAVAGLHAFAASFAILFALRVALGLAEAPSFPGAAQAVRRALPLEDRAAGFGLLFTGSSLGAMVAAPLAVALEARLGGWGPAFVGAAIVGLAWVPLWVLVTRPPEIAARLAPARDESGEAPRRASLLLEPAVLRAMVLVAGAAPAVMFVLLWAPLYLRATFGVPQASLGRYVWGPPLAFDGGAVLFGAIATARARRAAAARVGDGTAQAAVEGAAPGRRAEATQPRSHADLILVGAALHACIAFTPLASTPWAAVLVLSVSLVGGGALFARLTADMLARVAPGHASTAGGLTAAAQSLAYVVANPLVGAAVDRTHGYGGVLVVLGVLVIPAAIAWTLWPLRARAVRAGRRRPTARARRAARRRSAGAG